MSKKKDRICRDEEERKDIIHLVYHRSIDNLRKKIWFLILNERGDLSDSEVAFALSMIQYELIHHKGEK